MINTLQAGRFIAAIAVVFHHAVISVAAFVDSPPRPLQLAFDYGYLGVDFFFVLSGFIIHYTMHLKPRPAYRFALDRFGRIFLPYWPVALTLALAYTLLPQLSDGGRAWSWVTTLTLIPTSYPPALSVAWTLQHELVFYFIYAVLFFSGRIWHGLLIWTAAISVGNLVSLPHLPILQIIIAPINIEFIAGVAAASIFLKNLNVRFHYSLLIAATFTLAFVLFGGERDNSWLVGLSIAAFLPWVCRREMAGAFDVPSWLVFCGAASYAIYLTHNPFISLLSRALARSGMDWLGALVLSVVACGILGFLYYLAWERPIMRVFNRGQVIKRSKTV